MLDLPVAPGEILAGKYRVERVLGEGGHGVVVAAQHLTLGERVAIKVLRPEVAQDHETVTRFVREARAAVRIKGEHVTRVLDVGSLPSGMPFMVMEHLEGADLSTVIEQKGWLPVSTAVDYVLQTCEALAEAHALGIVHRDIKPSNLFLTTRPDGSPCIKVLDFGISKAIPAHGADAAEMNLTQTQTVLGSPQYMAPEQMRSSKRVDGRTDIWALGTTLHELLTGHPPFEAKTMPELFAMILQDPPPRLVDRRPDMPPALEVVVARCLEKDPEKRYADVNELARALGPLGSASGDAAVDRIGRVAFNTARSSNYLLPMDGGSAPGVDLSRTERDGRSEKTGASLPKGRWTFVFAAAATFMVVVGVAGIVIGVQRRSASAMAVTTSMSEVPSLPPAADPAPPSMAPDPAPAAATADAPTADAPTSAQAPSDVLPVASGAASVAPKRPDARPKVGPVASPHHAPPASAAPPARSTAPAPTQPPRAPGVASSRYD